MEEEILTLDDALRHIKLAVVHAHEYISDIKPKDSEMKFVQDEVLLELEESEYLLKCIFDNLIVENENLSI